MPRRVGNAFRAGGKRGLASSAVATSLLKQAINDDIGIGQITALVHHPREFAASISNAKKECLALGLCLKVYSVFFLAST